METDLSDFIRSKLDEILRGEEVRVFNDCLDTIQFAQPREHPALVSGTIKPTPIAGGVGAAHFISRKKYVLHVDILVQRRGHTIGVRSPRGGGQLAPAFMAENGNMFEEENIKKPKFLSNNKNAVLVEI
ncbi:hypothetical protein KP79_PYT09245 [Mizuhopecten yessoensis]|uniref:Uncharacterized protein n=1 Tax=Mizuhopecten yessoensis TaxID=6573 RepID=A0A210PWJ3_MIZYE|nr:hypothetical protein KP79_PYT09245 [Mizuhopecten yessoensis]